METETDVSCAAPDAAEPRVVSTARRLVTNSFFLTVANGSVTVLGAVYRIIIARHVGDAGYGKYYFVYTFAGMFVMLAGFGLRNALTRAIARESDRTEVLVAAGLAMRTITGISALVLMYSLLPFLNLERDVTLWIIIYGLICIPQIAIDVSETTFVGREVTKFTAVTNIAGAVVKIGAGVLALRAGYGLTGVFVVLVFSTVLVAAGDLWVVKHFIPGVKRLWPAERAEVRRLLIESLPFLALMVTSRLYYRNDVFFLKWLTSNREVGWYGAAYMPLDLVMNIANGVLAATYPIACSMYLAGPERVREAYARLSRYGWLAMFPFAIILTFLGKPILTLVLGDSFAKSADALKILCWATTIEVQVCLTGTFMNAMMRQQTIAKVSVVSLLMNIALNLILIPKFGYRGAAFAMLSSASVTWIINMILIRKALAGSVVRDSLLRPILAAAIGGWTLYALRDMGLALPLGAFLIAYAAIAVGTKATDGYERKLIARLFGSRRNSS